MLSELAWYGISSSGSTHSLGLPVPSVPSVVHLVASPTTEEKELNCCLPALILQGFSELKDHWQPLVGEYRKCLVNRLSVWVC